MNTNKMSKIFKFTKKTLFMCLVFIVILSVAMVRHKITDTSHVYRNTVSNTSRDNTTTILQKQTWRNKLTIDSNQSETIQNNTTNVNRNLPRNTIDNHPVIFSNMQTTRLPMYNVSDKKPTERKMVTAKGHVMITERSNINSTNSILELKPVIKNTPTATTKTTKKPTTRLPTYNASDKNPTERKMVTAKGHVMITERSKINSTNSILELKPVIKNTPTATTKTTKKPTTRLPTYNASDKNPTERKMVTVKGHVTISERSNITQRNSTNSILELKPVIKFTPTATTKTTKNPTTIPKISLTTQNLDRPAKKNNKTQRRYLVDSNACKIPDLDPFDASVQKYFQRKKQICASRKSLTFQDGLWLSIDKDVLNKYHKEHFSSCVYQGINRGDNSDDNLYRYSPSRNLTDKVLIKEDFVRVNCFNKTSRRPFYTNYHAFIARKEERINYLKKRLNQHKKMRKPREVLNVIMFGIDSLSRLNHIRLMKKTREYLLRHMSAIELQGYNKVADNTFVNLVPILRGKFVEELPWNESKSKEPFDKYNFIWKNFSSSGYVTSYVEDAPFIAIFNYLKAGFHQPPADHYARAYSMATQQDGGVWSGFQCIRDRPEIRILLNYSRDFIKVYKDHPHFAFNFLSHITHDYLSGPFKTDEPYYDMLKNLHQNGYLNNSVLFFLGDHGFRFGAFRKTLMGRMEERLPMMYLVFPDWFYNKYPEITKNLKINQNRLTTPFDIYETLKDILYFSGKPRGHVDVTKQRGISLFEEIPLERTCKRAAILPHWCVCLEHEELSSDNNLYNDSAEFLVTTINERTRHASKLCSELSLKKIKYVHVIRTNAQTLTDKQESEVTLQLAIVVKPGDGEFEATMKHSNELKNFKMAGDISRINKYGHDGDCIDNANLRRYCYCGDDE